MAFGEELRKRLDKKRAEISALENEVREAQIRLKEATSYAQALEDMLKIAPKHEDTAKINEPSASATLRPGTDLFRSKEAILKAGKPLHVTELLQAIGKPDTKQNRVSLTGSIGGYVRAGRIFTRPLPNVFSVNGLESEKKEEPEGKPIIDFMELKAS